MDKITAQDILRLWPDLSEEEAQEVAEAVGRYPALPDGGERECREQFLADPRGFDDHEHELEFRHEAEVERRLAGEPEAPEEALPDLKRCGYNYGPYSETEDPRERDGRDDLAPGPG